MALSLTPKTRAIKDEPGRHPNRRPEPDEGDDGGEAEDAPVADAFHESVDNELFMNGHIEEVESPRGWSGEASQGAS